MQTNRSYNIKLSLLFNGYDKVKNWWKFEDVISPFTRLYLITEGEGWVYHNNHKFHLTPGKLFLIPKFTFHSYKCNESMGHFYICFFDEMSEGGDIFDIFDFNYLINSQPDDYKLFSRLNELNPYGKILNPDPIIYDNNINLYAISNFIDMKKISKVLESQGIILQLLSRFISYKEQLSDINNDKKIRLGKVVYFINQNINRKISLCELSDQVYLSADYFSKIFYEIMGIRPMEYITLKRIERAQMLLVSTNLTISQIAEKVGFPNYSYFSTIFKKHTLSSPEQYKKIHFLNMTFLDEKK